jgi:hypothetical protein
MEEDNKTKHEFLKNKCMCIYPEEYLSYEEYPLEALHYAWVECRGQRFIDRDTSRKLFAQQCEKFMMMKRMKDSKIPLTVEMLMQK